MGVLISIDNGGTLTDACAVRDGALFHAKALTTPFDLTKCFLDVLSRLSQEIYGEESLPRLLAETDHIRYSTTQGTNSVVERKGPMLGLILARGMDVTSMNPTPDEKSLFDALVGERVQFIDMKMDDAALSFAVTKAVNDLVSNGASRLVVSLSGAGLVDAELRLRRALSRSFPRHLLGAVPVLLSSELSDVADDRRRTWSALLNSFLHPSIDRFLYGAEAALKERNLHSPLLIYRNDDNSTRVAKTVALKTYSSGPRGGVAGAEAFSTHYGFKEAVALDIGGTSSDIALIKSGKAGETLLGDVEGIPIAFPMMKVHSVGAGGGSIMRVKDGKITVGPDSVGATPGPAAFGRGGKEATVTDAYLVTGTFDPASYLRGTLHLDIERARAAIERNVAEPLKISVEDAAFAIIDAYKTKIAGNIKGLASVSPGSVLIAFGGGGPISACGVAERAGFDQVMIPRMAAVFSAFGIGFSDIAHSYEARIEANDASLAEAMARLREQAARDMFAEGFDLEDCVLEPSFVVRKGGEVGSVALDNGKSLPKSLGAADEIRLRMRIVRQIPKFTLRPGGNGGGAEAKNDLKRRVLVEGGGGADIPVYELGKLAAGDHGEGPALIEDGYFTCRIPAGWAFHLNHNGDIVAHRQAGGRH
jgi:N-methylhydantoinase A/oxoprolinase/acetone carboxylase beta subunit